MSEFKEVVVAMMAVVLMLALFVVYHALLSLPLNAQEAGINDVNELRVFNQSRTSTVEKVAAGLFSLFASFVGYYAGRIPAEKAVANAREDVKKARDETSQAQTEAVKGQTAAGQAHARAYEAKVRSDRASELLQDALPTLHKAAGRAQAQAMAVDPEVLSNRIENFLRKSQE